MAKTKKSKAIMSSLSINEISGVTVPAQGGALVKILKRKDGGKGDDPVVSKYIDGGYEATVMKRAIVTSVVNGHSHIIARDMDDDDDCWDTAWNTENDSISGYTTCSVNIDTESTLYNNDWHDHAWARNKGETTFMISTVSGHTHEASITTVAEKRAFTDEERATLAKAGEALMDGSFPIVTPADVRSAVEAYKELAAKSDHDKVAKHILKRATKLDAVHLLPTEGTLAEKVGNTDGKLLSTEKGNGMPNDNPKVEDLQKQLERQDKILKLSTAHQEYFKAIEGEDAQNAFLAKSADEQTTEVDAAVAKAKDADPVVYTRTDGTEMRKSAGEAAVNDAKTIDTLMKKNAEYEVERANAKVSEFVTKHLGSMPGDDKTKFTLAKAAFDIEDEDTRNKAIETLKSQNTEMAKAFETAGVSDTTPEINAGEDSLEKLTKAYQAANPDTSYEVAMAKVLDTPAGAQAYTESQTGATVSTVAIPETPAA